MSGSDLSVLAQLGLAGFIIGAFLTGLIVPGWIYKALSAREAEMRRKVDEQVIPALQESTRVLGELLARGTR